MDFSRSAQIAGLAATLALGACSGSGTSPSTPAQQSNVPSDVLELSVGTANIFGDLTASGANSSGLNVVAAYRQPSGTQDPGGSAVLVSTPALSGPFTLPATAGSSSPDFTAGDTATAPYGPGPQEVSGNTMTATPQGGSTPTTFGTSGGVFGVGIEPFNYLDGAPATNVPYAVPLYDPLASTTAGDPNAFIAWGGPPAFDLAGNGESVVGSSTEPAGQAGVSEGLDVFEGVTVRTGAYKLAVQVPANTGTTNASASATLRSTALLPAITPATPTLNGSGGGTFAASLPAGVTEAYIQVTDIGPPQASTTAAVVGCNGSVANPAAGAVTLIYYTIEVTPGAPSGTLPNNAGPSGAPSLCNAAQNTAANGGTSTGADQFTVQTIGFDYPLYESSYRNAAEVFSPAPKLAGPNGQSDVTISSAAAFAPTTAAGVTRLIRLQSVRSRLLKKTYSPRARINAPLSLIVTSQLI